MQQLARKVSRTLRKFEEEDPNVTEYDLYLLLLEVEEKLNK